MDVQKAGLRIRNAEARDAAQLARWWNDGAVMAHAGFPLGLGTTAEKVAEDLQKDREETRRRLILEWEQKPVGEMSYRILEGKTAEIGIKICEKAYQERHLGRRALSMLIGELFQRGCGKIVLDTNLNNTRAQHVYEKLGFQKMGVQYDAWTDQLGVKQCAVDYALTPERFTDYSSEK